MVEMLFSLCKRMVHITSLISVFLVNLVAIANMGLSGNSVLNYFKYNWHAFVFSSPELNHQGFFSDARENLFISNSVIRKFSVCYLKINYFSAICDY